MYLNVCKNVESRKDRRIAEVPEIREYADRLAALPTKYQKWLSCHTFVTGASKRGLKQARASAVGFSLRKCYYRGSKLRFACDISASTRGGNMRWKSQ